MQSLQPLPYAVTPVACPFRSIAQRAARLAIGGDREIALAALVAARMAQACVGNTRLARLQREQRANAARVWFSGVTLAAKVRLATQHVLESSAQEDSNVLAGSLEELIEVAGPVLDRAAIAELRALLRAISHNEGNSAA